MRPGKKEKLQMYFKSWEMVGSLNVKGEMSSLEYKLRNNAVRTLGHFSYMSSRGRQENYIWTFSSLLFLYMQQVSGECSQSRQKRRVSAVTNIDIECVYMHLSIQFLSFCIFLISETRIRQYPSLVK